MKKKYIIMAAILAALILLAVILGITVFSSPPDKGDEIILEPQPVVTPEIIVQETSAPTASPTPIPTPTPTFIEDEQATSTPTKKTESTIKKGYAFTLNIEGKKINIAYGVDEATLDKTPGWLTTSAIPGTDGMCVVYGHRNRTHLRVLEKVETGDPITVTMPDGTVYTYTVTDTTIHEKTENLVLPLMDGKTIVLVTCYPFRYSGNAPGKYLVIAKKANM